MKGFVLIAVAMLGLLPTADWAAEASLGWPEVIGLLAKAQTQATTCVEVLKSSGDKAALANAQLTYGMAKGEMDGVIAGLTTALVEGGSPDRLPTVRASLATAGQDLKTLCDAAVKMTVPNTKGVLEEIAKGAVDPLEPLAKFIERGEFSLCSRGGGAGAQAGAGLSCVTRSI